MNRRELLRAAGSATAAVSLSGLPLFPAEAATAGKAKDDFTFVHITDVHIEPELGATEGVKKAFAAVRALPEKPDFALIGGDLVFDANKVTKDRAALVYDLWQAEADALKLPLHYSIGNHDSYGLGEAATDSAKAMQNPDFGKAIWKRRLGFDRTYTHFDHKGWRFVQLDTLLVSPSGDWQGKLDADQIKWLDDLLRQTDRKTPIVFLTHFPFLTVYAQASKGTTTALSPKDVVENGKTFLEMIQTYTVPAVLQGHTHVVEDCRYLDTHFVTGGAICANWWKGKRFGLFPEGFAVYRVRNSELSWRYVSYGWDAAEHAGA